MKKLEWESHGVRARWWGRQTLSMRLVLAALAITVVVMGFMTAAIAWQTRNTAIQTTQREMAAALAAAEQSLQLVLQMATDQGEELMPVFVRLLGGEPRLDGSMAPTGEAGDAPRLQVDGFTVNGDTAPLASLKRSSGAEPAVIVRHGNHWVRAATLLQDESGNPRTGSRLEPDDLLATSLDAGKEETVLLQRQGRWYAMTIKPLKTSDGTVYGGLSVRVDVHNEMTRLLGWIDTVSVARHGHLGVLRPGLRNGTWLFASGARAGQEVDKETATMIEAVLRQPQGFSQAELGPDRTPSFIAWDVTDKWNWVLYGTGERDSFLAESDQALRIQLALMLGGMALTAGTIGTLAHRTLRPVQRVVHGMEQLGRGDLSGNIPDVPGHSRNEVHLLLANLKRTQANLAVAVLAVRQGVDQITIGSAEIAAGNADLSSRTEQQAASLQQTAASMEELASTVKQNADNAHQAQLLAVDASSAAEKGGTAVSDVVATMAEISNSSSRIAEIVGVIDSIAFQTNILALNAAVEAARAGDQGKGFAVVASEVRALAHRSALAAREIKDLISQSTNRVGIGSQQVEHAGATMQQIVEAVQRVAAIMREISSASEEQAGGIEQVNRAVAQMDEVTQQNAALVEQAAAAAGSLEQQASTLAQAVSVFRIKASHDAIAAPEAMLLT